MKKRIVVPTVVVLAVVLSALYGCPKKMETASTPEGQAQKVEAPSGAAAEEAARAAEAKRAADAAVAETAARNEDAERAAKQKRTLEAVYFDYDRSAVRDDARAVMQANAAYLKANPAVKVRIEGNCDERGTVEYNQALGQRRAASAKKYLVDMGVSGKRISLLSYGKEKPVCQDGTENCWQENRRADIVPVSE